MVGNMRAKNGPGFMAAAYVAANPDRFWGLGVIILSELSFVFLGHRKCFFWTTDSLLDAWEQHFFYVLRDTKEAFLFIYLFFNLRFDIRFMKTCHLCLDYGGNLAQRAPISTGPYPMVRGVVFFGAR